MYELSISWDGNLSYNASTTLMIGNMWYESNTLKIYPSEMATEKKWFGNKTNCYTSNLTYERINGIIWFLVKDDRQVSTQGLAQIFRIIKALFCVQLHIPPASNLLPQSASPCWCITSWSKFVFEINIGVTKLILSNYIHRWQLIKNF